MWLLNWIFTGEPSDCWYNLIQRLMFIQVVRAQDKNLSILNSQEDTVPGHTLAHGPSGGWLPTPAVGADSRHVPCC